jgi:hypothetical protein
MKKHSNRLRLLLLTALTTSALSIPNTTHAFCGFYVAAGGDRLLNNATQVVLMRSGQRTVLSMMNQYEGPPENFAMVVPVPIVLQQENVRTLEHSLFAHVEQLTAPRLVEYWERDPCYVPPPETERNVYASAGFAPTMQMSNRDESTGVRVEARFTVGEYNIVVLSATQSSGLETWLHDNHYNIPQGSSAALAPYVRDGMKFFVARVDIQRVQRLPSGRARLSPLRFHYDTPEFRLPVRLGLLNAPANQELVVYVLHPTERFEVANLPNVFIPTNLDVTERVKQNFASFYNRLFDATMQQSNNRAMVTEYAWTTQGCDPCTGEVLSANELQILGADVINDSGYHTGMTITRLHTRYSAETLTDDLVFRQAPAAVGGREHTTDANGGLERGGRIEANGTNNFQARYAIRHAWTGPIQCANPQRGVWQGPDNRPTAPPVAAKDLAEAPREALTLSEALVSNVPELGVRTGPAPGVIPNLSPTRASRGCLCSVPASSNPGSQWLARCAIIGALASAVVLVARAQKRARASGR